MGENTQVKSESFFQPWKFSDVVLVIEEERLHVHRAVLAMSSPVFEKMFKSEFPDKTGSEIPLSGKSSAEVKELLWMIYPSASEKQITEENSHFLLELAHEYQVDAIVQRCEDFLVDTVKTKPKDGVLAELVFAQTYKLEKLRRASVERACELTLEDSLEELKQDEMYDQIESENRKEIVEGIISRLERELEESQRKDKENDRKINDINRHVNNALRSVRGIARCLVDHAVRTTQNGYRRNIPYCESTDGYIAVLQMDDPKGYDCEKCGQTITCSGLSQAANDLRTLMKTFESLKV